MRKIITPEEIPDKPSAGGGGRSQTRKPKLSEEEFEIEYNSLHDKVLEFLMQKFNKGGSTSLDVTAYHDDVIKKVREEYEETGAWKADRNLDRDENGKLAVFIRFKSTRGS